MADSVIEREEALEIASRVLYELLGRRWVWPLVTTYEKFDLQSGQRWVSLEGRPVVEIHSVVLSRPGAVDSEVDYFLERKSRVVFSRQQPTHYLGRHLVCDTGLSITVHYTYGAKPPAELLKAIERLADEIELAYNDPDECSLPDTVTSVSRQGISMQMISAADFLEQGRTGISAVDRALRYFNPAKSVRKARVYGPAKPPPRRHGTTQQSVTDAWTDLKP